MAQAARDPYAVPMALGTEWGKPLTVEDVWRIPDDGSPVRAVRRRAAREPSASPAASARAHSVARRHSFRPPHGTDLVDACHAPFDWKLDDHTLFQPDIIVVDRAALSELRLEGTPPLLAVEVLSPSTRLVDQTLKRAKYEEAGVQHYWIVDPTRPTLTAARAR